MSEEEKKSDKSANLREHLANERTFLAWIRTSIAAISFGFVIARFSFWLNEIVLPNTQKSNTHQSGLSLFIGSSMIGFGAILSLLATVRYRTVRKAIEEGTSGFPNWTIILVNAGVVVLAVILIIYIFFTSRQFNNPISLP